MNDNADQATYWNDVAGSKWVANQARLDAVFAPLTRALIEAAAPHAGEAVLDIGCGCGETSLLAAARVGRSGRVLAVDLSRPMLAHAKTRAAPLDRAGAPITWLQADAMTHDFTPGADLMMSRFGVMFFADQVGAFRNIRRGLRPGGRFALMCWRPRADVEWMQWPLDQLSALLPPPEQTVGQPGPFGLADATATRRMLEKAGFASVEAEPVDVTLTVGHGPDPLTEAMTLFRDTGPVAVLFREAEPEVRLRAETMLRQALERQVREGTIRFGAACWLYTGRV